MRSPKFPDNFDRELSSRASFTSKNSFRSHLNYDEFSDDEYERTEDLDSAYIRLFEIIEDGMPLLNDKSRPQTAVEENQRNQVVEKTFKKIRGWLWKHQDPQVRADAMAVRGKDDSTPLHNVSQFPNPPDDIIQELVEASLESVMWEDSHGWLPLHHACAHSASVEVMRILINAFPQGAVKQDSHKRTPLHFYLIQCTNNSNAMVTNVRHLSQSGAPELADIYGMLPMHYACAYGVCPSVLAVLLEAYPDSMSARESKGRTPMHLALANAHRDASPGVTQFLLENSDTEIVNVRDYEGYLPVHLMPLGLRHFRAEEPNQRNNVSECMKMYLAAEPTATADFLTALQDLPEWLKDVSVVTTHVRNILNEKIVGRFPTFMLFLSFVAYMVIIFVFDKTSNRLIESMFDEKEKKEFDADKQIIILWIGATYFLLRELLQIVSLWSLGSISRWFKDPYNWLDVTVIVVIYYFSLMMTLGEITWDGEDSSLQVKYFKVSDKSVRSFAAFTKFILWMAVVSFLRTTLVDFAIFVGGVVYVTKRLGAFFLAVAVILTMFAQIFYFIYFETDLCQEDPCEEDSFPHCTFGSSIIKVITMVMGEIGNESRYDGNVLAQLVYITYAVIVVILLSNILIAIVTESYEVIQNDRAASVFWGNRLDIVAEFDAISYGVLRRLPKILGGNPDSDNIGDETPQDKCERPSRKEYFYHLWKNIIQLFDENLYDDNSVSPSKIEFWCYLIFQVIAVTIIIPVWLLGGLVTFGIMWPPQIREFILVQREATVSRSDMEKQKLEQLKEIENNLKDIKSELKKEILSDREEIIRMKNEVQSTQNDVMADLQQLRELMQTLLDLGRENPDNSLV